MPDVEEHKWQPARGAGGGEGKAQGLTVRLPAKIAGDPPPQAAHCLSHTNPISDARMTPKRQELKLSHACLTSS